MHCRNCNSWVRMNASSSPSQPLCLGIIQLRTYNFDSSTKYALGFLTALNSLLICPTLIANILVLMVIWKKPNVRCNAVYLLGFLAVTDALVGLAVQPLFVAYTVQVLLYKTPSCLVLVAYDLLSFLLCFWSVTTSLIVTADRYVAVQRPYSYDTILTTRRLITSVLVAWASWAVVVLARLLGVSGRIISLIRSNAFVVALLLTSAVYAKLVAVSRKHERAIAAQERQVRGSSRGQEGKAVKTAKTVVGVFLLSYVPLTVALQIFFHIRPPKQTRFVVAHWCTTLVFIDSLLNPFIYWWKNSRMRKALLEMLHLHRPNPAVPNSITNELQAQTSCTGASSTPPAWRLGFDNGQLCSALIIWRMCQ